MSWENILKKRLDLEGITQELLELMLDESVSQVWRDFVGIQIQLEEEGPNNKYIQQQMDNVWKAKNNFNSAIESLADALTELEEEESDKEDVNPDYRGYKLKDNEQWGEGEDGKLVPKPIDDQYGAEW
jgi:hypothetical protein